MFYGEHVQYRTHSGNMDVRFTNLNVRFTNLRLMEQDLLLHALFTDVDVTEFYLTSTVTDVGREPGASLLPTPIRLFHAPTPLPEKHPEHVCRHCQSSTCLSHSLGSLVGSASDSHGPHMY
jgi:hypothetical protein